MFSSSYADEKPVENKVESLQNNKEATDITSISIKNKNVDNHNNLYDKKISEKLKTQYNITDKEIKNYIGNSHFEISSYNIDLTKNFNDHQVKVPAGIPLSVSFDVYLWKCEDYVAIINIDNINVVPKNNFKYSDVRNKIGFWLEYFNGTAYDSVNFDNDILVTSFKEPVQFMIGLNGFEIENSKNKEVYKNFPIYIYFSAPILYIK